MSQTMRLSLPWMLLLLLLPWSLALGLGLGEHQLWDLGKSTRCLPIPEGMALCQDIGYTEMRLPNLLGHETRGEAVQQSASWLPLLARECHPDARVFLCSLFAPVCLDRFIYPCRGLCEAVRLSCAPIMACYGYPWPAILDCDQFPADHMMCIPSLSGNSSAGGSRGVPRASCRDCELEEATSAKDVLDTFCGNDFVVKVRLLQLNTTGASLTRFSLDPRIEVLKHGPLLGGEVRARLQLWLDRDATCVHNMTRRAPPAGTYVIVGAVRGDRLVVHKAYGWHKRDRNLMVATRKWKRHRCRG
ncbi:SFRP5 protein, partial [Atractosteus spatula]|nr:SFRP5 protein [Atractosteus spatula]